MSSRFSPQFIIFFFAWTLCVGGAGYALRAFLEEPLSEEGSLGITLRDENTPYRFIDPLLACNIGASTPSASLNDLQGELAGIVNEAKSSGAIESASIYVKNLQSGAWTGIEPDAEYTPASLMKVPILIAYLKQAEYSPDLLSYTVTITEDPAPNEEQDIAPDESVVVGATYTIDELLSLMIVHSDNRALNVLMNYLDFSILTESFTDLGIGMPEDASTYKISPRLYSRFFRILYSATYLSQESSEKALRLLNKATFLDGIRSGIPEEIDVSHKFGEASTVLASGVSGHELHDCGIVYADNAYAICIMTQGERVDDLALFLHNVSAHIYTRMH